MRSFSVGADIFKNECAKHYKSGFTTGFYVRANDDPEKNEIYFIFSYKRFLTDCFYIWHVNYY